MNLGKVSKKVMVMVIITSMLLALIGSFPVFASGENLAAASNPSFEEFNGDVLKIWTFTGSASQATSLINVGAQDGQYYVNLPALNDGVQNTNLMLVEPEKSYTLTFWMRNSVANSGYFDMRFFADGVAYNNFTLGSFKPVFGMHFYQEPFGVARATEPERLEWRKSEFRFTTPPYVNGIRLTLSNKAADPYLCFDNISLTESGEAPNYVRNGHFEAFETEGIPSAWTGTFSPTTIVSADENGNHVMKMFNPNYIYQEIYLFTGRYKMSFRYKNDSGANNKPMIRIYRSSALTGFDVWYVTDLPTVGTAGAWQDYTIYFTVPTIPDLPGANFQLWLPGKYDTGTYYYDDVVIEPDTESFVDFNSAYQSPGYNATTFKTSEKINPISALTDVEPSSGSRNISARVHYVPTTVDAENFTTLWAVYKDEAGVDKLHSMSVKAGTTTGGIVTNVTNSVAVPADGGTYTVKVFVWNSANNMVPITESAVLQ